MRNPIIRAFLLVLGFWWVVGFIWGAIHYNEVPEKFLFLGHINNVVVIATMTFIGSAFLVWADRWIRKGGLGVVKKRGVISSIGLIPNLVIWDRASLGQGIDESKWPKTAEWVKTAPNEYREAFLAIMTTIMSKPDLPASPVSGGHGGFTLFAHTLNVVEHGLNKRDSWLFERRKSDPLKGSALPVVLYDAAVLTLAGHDIGKMKAFIVEDGKVVDWKKSHDKEGAQILATLEEMWQIPEDDRKAIIAAVAHEHHPQDLPTHTGSETQLLMEFLIDIDEWASREEEGKLAIIKGQESGSEAHPEGLGDEEMWSWFLQMIAKPNTINGRDERFRVGFKDANHLIYFNEIKVRTALATEFFQDPLLAESKKGDGRAVITERLLKVLDAKGVLIKSWQDFHFGYKGALFKLESIDKKGKKLGEWATAFIVDLKEHLPGNVRALDPAPNPPSIVEPVFPQRRLKKESSIAQATGEALHDIVVANDDKQVVDDVENKIAETKREKIELIEGLKSVVVEEGDLLSPNNNLNALESENKNGEQRLSYQEKTLSSMGNDWDEWDESDENMVHKEYSEISMPQHGYIDKQEQNIVANALQNVNPEESLQFVTDKDCSIESNNRFSLSQPIRKNEEIEEKEGEEITKESEKKQLVSLESPSALAGLKSQVGMNNRRIKKDNSHTISVKDNIGTCNKSDNLSLLPDDNHTQQCIKSSGLLYATFMKGIVGKDFGALPVNEFGKKIISIDNFVEYLLKGGLDVGDLNIFESSIKGPDYDKIFKGLSFVRDAHNKISHITLDEG